MEAWAKLEQACTSTELGSRKRMQVEEEDLEYAVMSLFKFGWPAWMTPRDWSRYLHFVASLCPINMRFLQVGGRDRELRLLLPQHMGALPPLALRLCLLRWQRCCLLYNGTNSDLVLLRELAWRPGTCYI